MNPKSYKGAVLIIGSLYWDNSDREKWRNQRLHIVNKILVYAPIRYGRISGKKRKNTHTMVFSPSLNQEDMGTAWLVPFKNPVANPNDLIGEAKKLWEAEGGEPDRISENWGGVGLLDNPEERLSDELISAWKNCYEYQQNKPIFNLINNEHGVLSNDGILSLQWIKDAEHNQLISFNFILATATVPNNNQYPTSRQIAQLYQDKGYSEYFWKNRKHEITTFQDEEIEEYLRDD